MVIFTISYHNLGYGKWILQRYRRWIKEEPIETPLWEWWWLSTNGERRRRSILRCKAILILHFYFLIESLPFRLEYDLMIWKNKQMQFLWDEKHIFWFPCLYHISQKQSVHRADYKQGVSIPLSEWANCFYQVSVSSQDFML